MSVRAWRRASSVVAGVTLLLSGWSGVGAQQVSSAESGAVAPLQLVSPPFFDSAVASGTRSRTGAPGPRYWQNSADYEITAQITPADSLLRGSERITYHN